MLSIRVLSLGGMLSVLKPARCPQRAPAFPTQPPPCTTAQLRRRAASLLAAQPTAACRCPPPPADAVVSVRENEVALAACADPGWIISSVDNAMYGDVATQCNSSLTYT